MSTGSVPQIRPYRDADREAVISLLEETFATTWKPQLTNEAREAFRAKGGSAAFVDREGADFVLAEIDGTVVGMALRRGNFIDALHVRPARQRQGVGQTLLDHLEAEMLREGHETARLETDTFNEQSRAFYRRAGYVEAGRYPDTEWNSGLTTVLFEKML